MLSRCRFIGVAAALSSLRDLFVVEGVVFGCAVDGGALDDTVSAAVCSDLLDAISLGAQFADTLDSGNSCTLDVADAGKIGVVFDGKLVTVVPVLSGKRSFAIRPA